LIGETIVAVAMRKWKSDIINARGSPACEPATPSVGMHEIC